MTDAAAAAAAGTDEAGLTEYERQRLAHVARNREYMARLGVLTLAATISGSGGAKGVGGDDATTSRKRVRPAPGGGGGEAASGGEGPVRRSSRLQQVTPEHDGSIVDALREDEDVKSEAGPHTRCFSSA